MSTYSSFVSEPESAVAAYWKTFSPQHGGPTALVQIPRRKPTNKLPVELLLIIFQLVYEQELLESGNRGISRNCDLDSPSFFPYAIAAVCSLWRDAMALVPGFWTRVVIFVDSPLAPPSSVIRSHVSMSGDLPTQILITRTNFDRSVVDVQQERAQITSIMDVINPCLHRVQVLRFDIMFSSSLPPFPDGFSANALDHLELGCREDNGRCVEIQEYVTPMAIDRPFSALSNLLVDGRNYYNHCRRELLQTANSNLLSLVALSIANYTPLPNESFTSSDFLLPIIALDTLIFLKIDNVTLVPAPSGLPIMSSPSDLTELELTDISTFETVAEILSALRDITVLKLTRCAIGDPGIPFGGERGGLTLKEIGAEWNLVPFLRRWQSNSLRLINCPSFNNAVLREMMSTKDIAARNLVALCVVDCNNFSGSCLRRLVNNRGVRFGRGGIAELRVCGRVPEIVDMDFRALVRTLNRFEYRPSSPAASSSELD